MKKVILITSIFIFFTLLFTFPAVLHLSDKIIGDGADSSLLIGWQHVARTQVEKGVYPFSWTNYWRYPTGFDYSISYDSVIFISLGLFLYNFSNNPVLVYNISVLILVLLNGLFTFLFFTKLSNNKIYGVLGAIIYGFSFYVLARLGGHMNLIFIGAFPFFIYSLIVFKEKRASVSAFSLVGLSTTLIFLSSLQYFLILLGSSLIIVPIFYLYYPTLCKKYFLLIIKNVAIAAATVLVTLTVFLVFNAGHVLAFLNGTLTTLPAAYMSFLSPFPVNFYLPNTYIPLLTNTLHFPNTSLGGIEGSFYLGLIEMFLFILFLFISKDKKLKNFLLTSTIVLLIVSFGCSSSYMPYCYMYEVFPYKGITEMGRFYVILYLLFTIGIISVVKYIKPGFRWLILIIFMFVIFERLPSNFYLSDLPNQEGFIKAVKGLDSKAVLDLPIINQWTSTRQKSNYDLYSIYYQKPIVGGSIQWVGNTPESEIFLNNLSDLECGTHSLIAGDYIHNTMVPMLKKNGIRTIVFHKELEPFDEGQQICDQAMFNIETLLYKSGVSIEKVYTDKNTDVFQLE